VPIIEASRFVGACYASKMIAGDFCCGYLVNHPSPLSSLTKRATSILHRSGQSLTAR
jgi:hypothetical protein